MLYWLRVEKIGNGWVTSYARGGAENYKQSELHLEASMIEMLIYLIKNGLLTLPTK